MCVFLRRVWRWENQKGQIGRDLMGGPGNERITPRKQQLCVIGALVRGSEGLRVCLMPFGGLNCGSPKIARETIWGGASMRKKGTKGKAAWKVMVGGKEL